MKRKEGLASKKSIHNNSLVIVIAAIAATGGLLFGFDTGVISGAIPYFQVRFNLDSGWIELITTAGLVGAVLGALVSGRVSDVIGRKKVILASAFIFAIGALWSGLAPSAGNLLAARFFLGIAIGVSSFAVPLYIAEISPAKSRGVLVSLFQLLITIGILASYFSDLAFALPESAAGYAECWRPMLLVGIFPALILIIGMFFLPESPRWLMGKGFEDKSRAVLRKIENPDLLESTITTLKNEIEADKQNVTNWREIFKPLLHTPLIIAVGIMFVQQFTGINTIIYYSPKIFLMSGFDGVRSAIMASVSVGVICVVSTIISLFLVDKLGRRKLYFWGLSGMVVSLVIMGFCFAFQSSLGDYVKTITIICVWLYVGFFAGSLGPLGWLIVSEVFPLKVRGIGASLGSLSNWLFNGMVAFTFFKIVKGLTLPGTEIVLNNENLGNPAGAFWLYALVGAVGLVWGYYFIPETKGKSLEMIEEHWRKGKMPREL
ncbi:MAG: sugar porter family MFS transporter [Mariniphaga sp.]|nr:sugar porter family MFS transporter [Mariniphaga sp.]